jgi:4-aminobutyrate aminotransferase-like enzyme
MSLTNGYHGHGGSHYLSNVGSYNIDTPKTQGVEATPFPDMYRCPFPEEEATERYAEMVEDNINYRTSGKMAMFMMETTMGNGGCIPLPKDFVQRVIPMVKKAGGLLHSDEV